MEKINKKCHNLTDLVVASSRFSAMKLSLLKIATFFFWLLKFDGNLRRELFYSSVLLAPWKHVG